MFTANESQQGGRTDATLSLYLPLSSYLFLSRSFKLDGRSGTNKRHPKFGWEESFSCQSAQASKAEACKWRNGQAKSVKKRFVMVS